MKYERAHKKSRRTFSSPMLCQYCEAARYCQKCYDSKHVPFGTGSSQGWRTLIVCTFSGPSSCSVSRRLLHYVTSSIKMLAFVKNGALPFPLLKECTFCRTCTIKCVWSKCIVKRSFFDARFGGNQKRLGIDVTETTIRAPKRRQLWHTFMPWPIIYAHCSGFWVVNPFLAESCSWMWPSSFNVSST